MWEPNPSVRDAVGGEGYTPRQVLDAETLRAIHDVNRSFLANLGGLIGAGTGGPARLGYAAEAGGLTGRAREEATGCPYTLFNLRYEDGPFWRSVHAETLPALPLSPSLAAFGRGALVLAWHLVRSREMAAPIALGMTAPVVEVWRAMPVSALDYVGAVALPYLAPRWPHHERFWSSLARAAGDGCRAGLNEAFLLGLQLLAADGLRAAAGTGRGRR